MPPLGLVLGEKMLHNKKTALIIVAAGRGKRAKSGNDNLPKQYRKINNIPLLKRTISKFFLMQNIDYILPIIHPDDKNLYNSLCLSGDNLLEPVFGGKTRQISVFNGLSALEKYDPDFVLIHDGARPFITEKIVKNIITALEEYRAVIPVINVIDTIKRSADGRTIGGTEDRTQLFAAQTPQGFHFKEILAAHKRAISFTDNYSDDSAIAQWAEIEVAMCEGDEDNIKITTKNDFLRAERLLHMQNKVEIRVGSAFDVHQFIRGDYIILGGIKIPHNAKLKGHSDADAVLHVITDAILGALAKGDIGTHFPPSEKKWKNEPSSTFVKFATNMLKQHNGRIINLDVTIITQNPKISPFREKIRHSIANICNIEVERVSVKATTAENLGFIGREEGLAAMASLSIELKVDN